MRRRDLLAMLSGSAIALPWVAHAQQRVRRVGVLMGNHGGSGPANAQALTRGLAARDWREGGNLLIDWRWGGDDAARYQRGAAELTALRPDVLLAGNSPALETLQQRAGAIPIVFVNVTDPVGQGAVESLSRPGGTISGFANYDTPMAGKWLEMLTLVQPPVRRVAVLFDPSTAPYVELMVRAVEKIAPSLALSVRAAPCRDEADIDATMTALAREEGGGLMVPPSVFTATHRRVILALAARHRLPAVYAYRTWPAIGGLMSYGVDQPDLFRRAADYVDRILKGARPSDLPVQAPTKFETVVNAKTAKALGLTIAPSLLARADEVIG